MPPRARVSPAPRMVMPRPPLISGASSIGGMDGVFQQHRQQARPAADRRAVRSAAARRRRSSAGSGPAAGRAAQTARAARPRVARRLDGSLMPARLARQKTSARRSSNARTPVAGVSPSAAALALPRRQGRGAASPCGRAARRRSPAGLPLDGRRRPIASSNSPPTPPGSKVDERGRADVEGEAPAPEETAQPPGWPCASKTIVLSPAPAGGRPWPCRQSRRR